MKKELNSIVASNVVSLSPLQEYQSSDILSIASLLKGIANDKMNVFCKILMSKNPMFIDVSVHSQRNKIEKIMDELFRYDVFKSKAAFHAEAGLFIVVANGADYKAISDLRFFKKRFPHTPYVYKEAFDMPDDEIRLIIVLGGLRKNDCTEKVSTHAEKTGLNTRMRKKSFTPTSDKMVTRHPHKGSHRNAKIEVNFLIIS